VNQKNTKIIFVISSTKVDKFLKIKLGTIYPK